MGCVSVDSMEFNLKHESTSRCAEIKRKSKSQPKKAKETKVLKEKVKRLSLLVKYLMKFNQMESDCAGLKGRRAAFVSRNIRSAVSYVVKKIALLCLLSSQKNSVCVSRYSLLNLNSVFNIFFVARCSNCFV